MANTSSYVRVDGDRVDNPTDDTTYIFNETATLKTFTLAGQSDGDTIAISGLSTDFKLKVKNNLLTLTGLKTGASAGTIIKVQLDNVNGGTDHLAFLDGKIDVQFTPNEPGSLKGDWVIAGVNIARKYNFANHAGEYAIDSSFTFEDASYAASGVLDAQRYLLTTETDDIVIEHDNTYDLVRGIIDYQGEDGEYSTVTTLDTITGNGHTALEIGVHNTNGGHDADFICLTGVDKITVVDADDSSGALTMDAGSYSDEISNIRLEGDGNMDLTVNDLSFTGQLDLDNANESGCLIVNAVSEDLDFYVCIDNCSGTSEAIVGVGGLDLSSADCSCIYVDICQTASGSTQDLSIGDMTIGDVFEDVGVCGYHSIDMCNYVCVGHTGDATAGDMTVGNLDIAIGVSGSATMYMTNCAEVSCGDATAGNLTIGDIIVSGEYSSYNCGYVYNSAHAEYGDATVGNLTFGDINIEVANCSTGMYMYAYNCAMACCTSADAVAGDLTAGNISFVGQDDFCFWLGLYNSAYASTDGATATIGDLTVGNLSFDVGCYGSVCFDALNDVCAYYCGETHAGDVTVGDVDVVAGTSGYFAFELGNYTGTACTGVCATAGNVTVGDIDIQMNGVYNCLSFEIYNCAYACSGATTGNVTVGDIDVYGGADSYVYIAIDNYVCGEAGDVTIGNVDIQIENEGTCDCGSACFDLDLTACSFGNVSIGDITMKGGTCAWVGVTFSLDATCGSIGNVTIGDVYIGADTDGSAQYYACVCADDDIGNVNYGNITIDAAGDDSCICASICLSADYGCIGDINVGDVTINAAGDNACAYMCLSASIDDEIGNVTIGDVSINAMGSCASACFVNEITNCYGDIGNITYGNISLVADGEHACAYGCITASGSCYRDIGTYTVGDVSLTVSGEDASACLVMSVTSAETLGQTTVGDINITMDIAVTSGCDINSSDYAYAYYCMCSCADDVDVGDISVSAAEVTSAFDGDADVCAFIGLCAYSGDLHIGNVTVTGGYSNAGGVADNFGTLRSLIDICYDGSASIGNVDYSGYGSTACIDVDDLSGAAIIWAAQDDTDISLNDSKNTVYLGDGADIVRVGENATDPTLLAGIDLVYNFQVGTDVIETNGTSLATGAVASSYANFLTTAASQLSGGYDVYVARFGGDTYIAVDTGSNAVDYVVKLVGVNTSLSNADVGI